MTTFAPKRKKRSEIGAGLPILQNPELRAQRSKAAWDRMNPEDRAEHIRKSHANAQGTKADRKKAQSVLGDLQRRDRYRVTTDSRHFRAGDEVAPISIQGPMAQVRVGRKVREVPSHHLVKIDEGIVSFRQFLAEMPYYTEVEKDHEQNMMDRKVHSDIDKSWKKISTLGGHDVHKRTFKEPDGEFSTYRVVHPNTKKVVMELDTEKAHGGEQVTMIGGARKSPVKAHQLYHHLVTQHGVKLHSDTSQSPGGVHIWKQLHAMPGIKLTHHSNLTGRERELHTGSNWDMNYGFNSYFRAEKA